MNTGIKSEAMVKNKIFIRMINNDWVDVIKEVNANSKVVLVLYRLLRRKFLNISIDEKTLCLSTCLLENNNILFHGDANYKYYQDISFEVFKRLDDIKSLSNKKLFYRFCFAGVYSDYFTNNQEKKELYKKCLISGLRYFRIKYKKGNSDQTLADYLLGLIHMSQYYLFMGNIEKNNFFLNKVSNLLKKGSGLNENYMAFFYYHYSWSFFERHNYKKALSVVNKLLDLKFSALSEPIILHAMNIKCAMLYALKRYDDCLDLANTVSENSKKIFSINNQDVYAESLLNIAKCFIKRGNNLLKAKNYAQNAISILAKFFLGHNIDPSQALANIVLGEAYEQSGDKDGALNCFKIAGEIYESVYLDKVKNNIGYLKLMEKIEKLSLSKKIKIKSTRRRRRCFTSPA